MQTRGRVILVIFKSMRQNSVPNISKIILPKDFLKTPSCFVRQVSYLYNEFLLFDHLVTLIDVEKLG